MCLCLCLDGVLTTEKNLIIYQLECNKIMVIKTATRRIIP